MPGCVQHFFAIFWGAITLVFDVMALLILVGVVRGDEIGGASRLDVFLFFVLFLLPFNVLAIGFWRVILRNRQQDRRPSGVARVTPVPTGWRAELPDDGGPTAAAVVLLGVPIAAVFGLLWAFRMLPPAWASGAVLGVTVPLAAWAYRRWYDRPILSSNEGDKTLTLPMGRGQAPQTVAWSAVVADRIDEVLTGGEDGDALSGYALSLKLQGKGGTRFTTVAWAPRREPLERFAAWLRERTGRG